MLPMSLPTRSAALRDAAMLLRSQCAMLLGFSASAAMLLLAPTIYMLQVYDRVLGTRNLTTLVMLTLLVLGVYVLLAAIEQVRGALLVRLAARLDARLAPSVFDAALAAQDAGRASAPRLVGDLATLRQVIGGPLPAHLLDAPLALVFVLAAFLFDPWLGLFVCVAGAVLVALAWRNERRSAAPLVEAAQGTAQAAQQVGDVARHAEAIRALGMGAALRGRWLGANRDAQRAQSRAADAAAGTGSALRLVRLAAQSLALGLGAWLVLEGRISAGMMIAASVLLGRAIAPIEGLVAGWRQVVAWRDAWARLDEALCACVAQPKPVALPAARGALQWRAVGWTPAGPGSAVLDGVGFDLEPGQALAVVGASGSGKSTLARLAAGAIDPSCGSVRLDGAEFAQWPPAQRAQAIGYLPQDVQLFEATVAENIARMGAIDDAAVIDAAQRAGVHELVLRLPQGYQTVLRPGVVSGGQRQRLGLARALYGRPRLLVLDEPNAHLDDRGEQALLAALQAHKADGGSVLLVSHRLAVMQAVDQVLVLEAGRVAAYGPRQQLMRPVLQARTPAKTA